MGHKIINPAIAPLTDYETLNKGTFKGLMCKDCYTIAILKIIGII